MAHSFQVTFDAADPHRLAAFWAVVLGYDVEDHDEFIRGLRSGGYDLREHIEEVDGRLRWRSTAAILHPDGRGASGASRLLFQQVPEAKVAKNRVHLDVNIGPAETEAAVARFQELGATILYRGQEGPTRWVTMADPEGNELCVQ
jgi:hypothetical protein